MTTSMFSTGKPVTRLLARAMSRTNCVVLSAGSTFSRPPIDQQTLLGAESVKMLPVGSSWNTTFT